jgi:hypothetical protein
MEVLIMGQSNPGGTHYQDLLREYERNLYNAQARDNRSEIDHWERTIDGLRQEAANRGIRI